MTKLEYIVRFTTPAFLGNAEQAGQWRTPPFKALIRQWWRVAETAGRRPVTADIHCREGELFGQAADEGTTASQVKLRMDWRGGQINQSQWQGYHFASVMHPEVNQQPDVALYLSYGPVAVRNRLNRKSALAPGQPRSLKLGVPTAEGQRFRDVARLAHAFGALGSRCRNGWGSLHFEQGGLSAEELAALFEPANCTGRDWLRSFSRDWRQALDTDWCHALGCDDAGLLLWRTEAMQKWEEVLKTLAEVKIEFRTRFHFRSGGRHSALCDRQVLAYPVTNHPLDAWPKDRRSANQVLFKVLPSNGGYVGLVAHLPHGLPVPLVERLSQTDRAGLNTREQQVWSGVHAVLNQNLTRLP